MRRTSLLPEMESTLVVPDPKVSRAKSASHIEDFCRSHCMVVPLLQKFGTTVGRFGSHETCGAKVVLIYRREDC